MSKINIRNLDKNELGTLLLKFDNKAYLKDQIFSWIHGKNIETFEEMTNISQKLILKLKENFTLKSIVLSEVKRSIDETIKFKWLIGKDKNMKNSYVESVFIKDASRGGKNALCV